MAADASLTPLTNIASSEVVALPAKVTGLAPMVVSVVVDETITSVAPSRVATWKKPPAAADATNDLSRVADPGTSAIVAIDLLLLPPRQKLSVKYVHAVCELTHSPASVATQLTPAAPVPSA
jgi:hypothetical protein